MSPFAEHEIVSHYVDENFGTWILKKKYNDKEWDGIFWVRVTAADRLLIITGDFDPIVFAYGPRDPKDCVHWMGKNKEVSHYVIQKACIGTGSDRIFEYDTNLAKSDLQALLNEELEENGEETALIKGIKQGLEVYPEYTGILGVHEFLKVILEEDPDAWEILDHVGKRPRLEVGLSLQALNRLSELLQRESHD